MADSTPKSYSTDPALYLYTSLTSGSSHIVTATSRMETILKANKIPFKALDIATDEKARMLWGRRAGKDESGRVRKIPGLVQMGLVIGDIVEVEDWNEYGELKLHIKIHHEGGTPAGSAAPTPSGTPSKTPATQAIPKDPNPPPAPELPKAPEAPKPLDTTPKPAPEPSKVPDEPLKSGAATQQNSITLAMRQLGQEAAQKAKEGMRKGARGTETFSGKGKAEPAKQKALDKAVAASPPLSVETDAEKHTIEAPALLQSPTSSAWKNDAHQKLPLAQHSFDKAESLQSPTSTTWKSVEEHGGPPKPATEAGGKVAEHDAKSKDEQQGGEEDEEEDDDDDDEEEEDEEEEDDDDDEEEEDEEDDDEEDDDDVDNSSAK